MPVAKKKDIGRPAVINPLVLRKLEEVFALGGSDEEACLFAGIGKTTLYEFQKQNPEFTERKETLKQSPILKARQTVVKALKKDPELAFKYLERKRKEEFSPRFKQEHSGQIKVEQSARENLLRILQEACEKRELEKGQESGEI